MAPTLRSLGLALAASACSSPIQHGLPERDANEVVSVLVSRGFHAAKSPEKGKQPAWTVEVGADEADRATLVLTELKLPRPARATTRTVVQSAGLIETPAGERLRQLEGLEGDLEEALETLGGVAQASVELVVPSPPRPGQPAPASKASVLLRVRPEALPHLTQAREDVRALVAGGVEGLRPEEVVLVLDPVALSPAAPPEPPSDRPLVLALAAAVAALLAVLVALGALLRRRPRPVAAERVSPAASPSVPRRVD